MMRKLFFLYLLCIISGGCQPTSYESFQEKGRAKTRSLISELKKIRTKDQLVEYENRLEGVFDDFTVLCSLVEQFQKVHPEMEPLPLKVIDRDLSEQLQLELLRIYRLEGGREVIDRLRRVKNPSIG